MSGALETISGFAMGDIPRLWIDGADLVRSELTEHWVIAFGDHDSVRDRVRRWHAFQIHVAGPRIESSDEIRLLVGEPQDPVAVEHRRMRINSRAWGWQ